MKSTIIILVIIIILIILVVAVFIFKNKQLKEPTNIDINNIKTNMEIKSSVFKNNQYIPAKYTCDGDNINPPLEFSNVPSQAKSLVLIVDDPDAPSGTWVHWVVFNIDPKLKKIFENSAPSTAIEGITSFGRIGYGGPCPPSGIHRYFFKLYALDTKLDLNKNANKNDVEAAMNGHVLATAELIGLYKRK